MIAIKEAPEEAVTYFNRLLKRVQISSLNDVLPGLIIVSGKVTVSSEITGGMLCNPTNDLVDESFSDISEIMKYRILSSNFLFCLLSPWDFRYEEINNSSGLVDYKKIGDVGLYLIRSNLISENVLSVITSFDLSEKFLINVDNDTNERNFVEKINNVREMATISYQGGAIVDLKMIAE